MESNGEPPVEARLKLWKSAGVWWWELKTHATHLMTADRYVDGGTADTLEAAYGDAELGWIHFMSSWKKEAA